MAGGTASPWMIDVLVRSVQALVLSQFGSRKLLGMLAKTNSVDLAILGELIQTRKVTPVIDRRYPLSEVPAAIRYLEEGHARGKVVIAYD